MCFKQASCARPSSMYINDRMMQFDQFDLLYLLSLKTSKRSNKTTQYLDRTSCHLGLKLAMTTWRSRPW